MDIPINSMVIFHFVILNYQRVDLLLVLTFGMRLQKYVGAMRIMIDRQDMARQVLSFWNLATRKMGVSPLNMWFYDGNLGYNWEKQQSFKIFQKQIWNRVCESLGVCTYIGITMVVRYRELESDLSIYIWLTGLEPIGRLSNAVQ